MITNRLKKLLLENNIVIDYKVSSLEFNTKKDFIINLYQLNWREKEITQKKYVFIINI